VHQFFSYIFEIVFPSSEEAQSVRALSSTACATLFRETTHSDTISLSSFKEPIIRTLIHEAKFHKNVRAQELLASFVCAYVENHPKTKESLWIPVPLSPSRVRERGFNQTIEVLRYVKEKYSQIEIGDTVLTRIRDTTPQTTLAKKERTENMKNAFLVTAPLKIKGRNIIVVDDVMTTGATLRAAKAALLPHEAVSITLLALSH